MVASVNPGDHHICMSLGLVGQSWEIDVVSSSANNLAVWGILRDLGQTVHTSSLTLFFC